GAAHAAGPEGAHEGRGVPRGLRAAGGRDPLVRGGARPVAVPELQDDDGPDADVRGGEVLRLHHLRPEGDVPGPADEAGRLRRQGPGAYLRTQRRQLQHDAADGEPGYDPARGRVHARGLPVVVLVVQPDV